MLGKRLRDLLGFLGLSEHMGAVQSPLDALSSLILTDSGCFQKCQLLETISRKYFLETISQSFPWH